MPISITCTGCDKKLKVPDAAAGKKIRCPACKAVIAVPVQEEFVEPDDLVEPDEETAVTESPPVVKKAKTRDKEPADEETAISESSTKVKKKKAEWDDEDESADSKKSRKKDTDDGYGLDEDDEEEEERRRKKKKKKRYEDDFGDMRPKRRAEAHRGVLILVLGLVTLLFACLCPLVCWLLGTVTLNMANTDLARMENRTMDRSGQGMTTAGKICGMIGVALGLINFILGIALRISGHM
jgi:phage FluMu protein Com